MFFSGLWSPWILTLLTVRCTHSHCSETTNALLLPLATWNTIKKQALAIRSKVHSCSSTETKVKAGYLCICFQTSLFVFLKCTFVPMSAGCALEHSIKCHFTLQYLFPAYYGGLLFGMLSNKKWLPITVLL